LVLAKDQLAGIIAKSTAGEFSLLSRSLLFPTILHADDVLVVARVSRVIFHARQLNHSFAGLALRGKCSKKEQKLTQPQLLA
jgi:hypothetical protein